MKQQQLIGYRPNYPRKVLRGAALTAAALMAMSGATGCQKAKTPEPLATEGMVAVTEPPEETLVLDGEVAVCEPTEEDLVLDGEVAICEPTPVPDAVTTGMVYIPSTTPQN